MVMSREPNMESHPESPKEFSEIVDQHAHEWSPELVAQVEAIHAAREAVKAKHPELFSRLQKCFFEHDPIGINFEFNADEYDPEVGTVIPRLPDCQSQADVLVVVHEEFVRWFGAVTAGDASRYEKIAADVCRIWKKTLPGNTV